MQKQLEFVGRAFEAFIISIWKDFEIFLTSILLCVRIKHHVNLIKSVTYNLTNPRVQSQQQYSSMAWVKNLVNIKRNERTNCKEYQMHKKRRGWMRVIVSYANFNELKILSKEKQIFSGGRRSLSTRKQFFCHLESSMQFILIQEIKKMLILPSLQIPSRPRHSSRLPTA